VCDEPNSKLAEAFYASAFRPNQRATCTCVPTQLQVLTVK